MPKTLKVALAGAGAFGLRHLDAIKLIDGVETISLIGRELDKTKEVAAKYGVGHVTTDLADALKLPGLDAVTGGAKPKVAHRFYHVPASNTAVGHLILENAG